MRDNLIPFPHTNGSNGSAQVRVVPYPARVRAVVEHADHTLDAWDQLVQLVPQVEALIDVIVSLGILVDERGHGRPGEWIEDYWRLVDELFEIRQGINVTALTRDYGPDASPVPRYDDKLDDEIEVAQQDLAWLIPVLDEMTATIDRVRRYLRENKPGDAAEAVGELIGMTDEAGFRLGFGELFHCWQSYRLDAQGYLIDDEGQVYAHLSEFEDEEDDA